jgi:hypothetical protein
MALPSSASQTQRFAVLEFIDPALGHEAEFETWWPSHLKQMQGTPGFISADVFQLAGTQLRRPSAVPLPGHLAVYFLSTDDLPAIESRLNAETLLSPAVDPKSSRIFLYCQTGVWTSTGQQPKGDFFRQLVFGNAFPGREDEFNRWYDGTHAHDLLTVRGVVGVTRLRFTSNLLGRGEAPPKYLSMMDFSTTSVSQFAAELDQVGARFANTDAFDVTHAWRQLYQRR